MTVYQVPESSPVEQDVPWDRIQRGKRCLVPAVLFGLLTVGVWLFRNYSDLIRYGVLIPGAFGAGYGGYAMVQFKENGGTMSLRLLTLLILGLSMFPIVWTMTWWIDH